jgi:toxin FitB
MSKDLLIDTNVWSELIRRVPNKGVIRWYESSSEALFLSVVTFHEFQFGLLSYPSALMLKVGEKLIAGYEILSVDAEISKVAAQLRAKLAEKGKILHLADALIAATSKVNKLTLVTRNTKDFEGTGVGILNPFT